MGIIVTAAGKFFFPHRKKLQLFKENYSPDILRKIIYAGAHTSSSFEYAQQNLTTLAEFPISTSHIQRLMVTIGREFGQVNYQNDNFFDDMPKQDPATIRVAAISVDGGRTQLRQEDAGAGVHNPSWVETKVGCLQVLESCKHTADPHPDLPTIFKNKTSVQCIVEGIKGTRKTQTPVSALEVIDSDHPQSDSVPQKESNKRDASYAPTVLKKLVIADIDHAESFGLAVYNKVHVCNLHTLERKAYLGDGDRKLWTIFEDNFRAEQWTPILDFVHAVEYAYEGAKLITATEDQCWAKYIDFITLLWQGKSLTVVRRLHKATDELKSSKKNKLKETVDKIDTLTSIANYFQHNISKMDYPTYRTNGLPISSCHVESLIKQFNIRIKSSEKFWNKTSVKGILKIKSSILSNDNSWNMF
ncbi:MAG: hypothetical protein NT082_06620 [Chloroflexi bacterium]|nr:hypothetical protein [Chloroflexota bacterium]